MKRLLSLLALWLAAAGAIAATKPNILVILSDDAGYVDFGFQGGGIQGDYADLTPHLDSLATNGVRFRNGYASAPICCPSRAGLLTGRYQQRFGFENNVSSIPQAGLAPSQPTMADRLKALGYRTYAVGKWHLGEQPEHHPNARGFDEFVGFISGERTYFQYAGPDGTKKLQRNGNFLNENPGLYLTDVFASAATNYIAQHVATTNAPFFMYLAFNGVHAPLEANAGRLADSRIQDIGDLHRRTNAAMTIAVDDAVGVVLNRLTQLGIRTNTLVVFLNDNGGPEDNAGELNAPNWSDNGPLRDGKRSLYEGGIRVPFVASWPGTIPIAPGGRLLDDPVIALDLLPTFIAAAGGQLFPGVATDGANLLPRLTGAATNPIARSLVWRTRDPAGEQSAVRRDNWKLYRGTNGAVELYDLATDLGENNNLAGQFPERVTALLAEHAAWEEGVIEPLWGFGSPNLSTTNLILGASSLGYELVKSNAGFAFANYELRTPLSLSNDWMLTWSMVSRDVPGFARNGYIVLGSSSNANDLVRIGLDLAGGVVGTIGTMSILEIGSGASTNRAIPVVSASQTFDFRVEYTAATHTLTLRYGSNTVSHILQEAYGAFTHAGYALQASAQTSFSPIVPYVSPLARGRSPSWTRLKMKTDYRAGTNDINGNFMGGTELLSLVPHKGRLFAGVGYWNDEYFIGITNDPFPGPQVLVKDSATSPWRQDKAFGTNFVRVESLHSLTFTTDFSGTPLTPPVSLLLAGVSLGDEHVSSNTAHMFIRNDATGEWTLTVPGSMEGHAAVRFIFDHKDRVTGIHHVFSTFGESRVVRGGYDPNSGLIVWNSTPELHGSERILSGGNCNGWAYVCVGTDGNPNNQIGGVFWREDGTNAQWRLVIEFPDQPDENYEDVRGFGVVPHPEGYGYEVALVALNSFSKVVRIDPIGGDPRSGHVVTEEIDIRQFLGDYWSGGTPISENIITAYNDMPELPDPATGQPVRFLGMFIKEHPAGPNTVESNSAWYLIRRSDATYDWGQIVDPANPTSYLRSCRAARLSPFAEDGGRVLYCAGFDSGGTEDGNPNAWHNTAWIYRAELPDERARIRMDGTTPVIGIDAAYRWTYQLEATPTLTNFQPLGPLAPGSNTVHELRHTNATPAHDFYRWRISR